MKIKKLLGLTTTVVISALILGACGQSKNEDAKVVRVGTMVKSKTEKARWDKIEELVKKKGVKLKFTEFTDYTQPNKAFGIKQIRPILFPLLRHTLLPLDYTLVLRTVKVNTKQFLKFQIKQLLLSQTMQLTKVALSTCYNQQAC